MFTSLDGNGDGCVTEAELRAAAEARGIELTEEQVQAFMALEADGVCVSLEAFLNSVDGSVEGTTFVQDYFCPSRPRYSMSK